MRKLILILSLLITAQVYSAGPRLVNRWYDTTWFGANVQFDTLVAMKGLKIAGVKDTFVIVQDLSGKLSKIGKKTFLNSISGGAGNQDLQGVCNEDNNTTTDVNVVSVSNDILAKLNSEDTYGTVSAYSSTNEITLDASGAYISGHNGANGFEFRTDNLSTGRVIQFPDAEANLAVSVNGNYADVNGNIIDRKVDTIYLNTTNDSTIYLINGTRHAIPRGALTFAKNSAGDSIVLTVSGVRTAVKDSIGSVTATSTSILTNKRITARVDSTTSSATPTINTDNVDTYKLTAQAADITSFTTNLSGTPTDDQILHIVIIGTATLAITWGSKFESSTVTLPTTTVGTARLDVYFIWNTATSKWRCGGVW